MIFSAVGGLGAAAALIYSAGQLEGSYEREAKAKANAYSERADIAIAYRCSLLSPPAKQECVREERQAAREGNHDEYDLQAQLVTSVWTKYMGIAAISGTAFGIIGVALVLFTFWQSKRSADAAHAANRPWIALSFSISEDAQMVESGLLFYADVTVKNVGRSPAVDVRLQWEGFNMLNALEGRPEKYVGVCRQKAVDDEVRGFLVAPNQEVVQALCLQVPRAEFEGRLNLWPLLVISSTYRDSELHQTATGFVIERLAPRVIPGSRAACPFLVDEVSVPARDIKVRVANVVGTAT